MPITKTLPLGSLAGAFRWTDLRGLVDAVNAAEPAHQDRISCRITGNALIVEVERELTPAEEIIEVRRQQEAFLAVLRDLVGDARTDAGRGLGADRADAIRRLVGAGDDLPIGTRAAPIGPASVYTPADPLGPPPPTDEDRREAWLEHMRTAGWKAPDDLPALRTDAKRLGVTQAEAEAWTPGAVPGSFGA